MPFILLPSSVLQSNAIDASYASGIAFTLADAKFHANICPGNAHESRVHNEFTQWVLCSFSAVMLRASD